VRQWKIGVWTTGIGLICIGVIILLLTNGMASWHILAYIWPLLIIGFGLELILSRVLYPESGARVSGLALVFIVIVFLASLGQFTVERIGSAFDWQVAFGPSYSSKVHGQTTLDSGIHKVDIQIVSGDVTVTGVDGSTVSYDGSLPIAASSQAEADKKMKVEWKVEKVGDTLTLKLDERKSLSLFNMGQAKGSLTVQVPKALLTSVEELNGAVHVNGVNANSTVHTTNGSIAFQSVQGNILGETTNGDCSATDVSGGAELRTTNGHVSAINVHNSITVHTTNGGIDVSSAVGGPWAVHTTNGSISCHVNTDANANFTADTTTGKVGGSLPWQYDDNGSHHGNAKLGSGQFSVELHTTNGSITVNAG
jgi:DUF4097 and DUF4098 domain-containing protein YvlB